MATVEVAGLRRELNDGELTDDELVSGGNELDSTAGSEVVSICLFICVSLAVSAAAGVTVIVCVDTAIASVSQAVWQLPGVQRTNLSAAEPGDPHPISSQSSLQQLKRCFHSAVGPRIDSN